MQYIARGAMDYKRYDTTLEDLKARLDIDGVATIPSVLSADECAALREKVWDGIAHVTKGRFNINDESTWSAYYDLLPIHSMLLQRNVGHMQPVWDIRQHDNVRNVFSKIWNMDDLLVSFDGISIHLPSEKTKRGWYRNNNWLHTDQSSKKQGMHCVQGLINLYPVNKHDATLSVMEGSHKFHEPMFKEFKKEVADDWYKITEEEYTFLENKGCRQTCLEGDEGSMFLWDSRTFHQGIEAQKEREHPNFRMVVYVCMTPRSKCTAANLNKRVKAFESLRMTTHWPHLPKLFPTKPRLYPGMILPDCAQPEAPVLTPAGHRLVGYDE